MYPYIIAQEKALEDNYIPVLDDTDEVDEMYENFDDIAQAIARGILDGLTSAGEIQNTNYRVQVGLFRNWNYAQRLENELLEQGFPAFIDDSGQYISVQVGEYQTLEEAAEAERQLKNAGYQTLIVS